MPGGKALHMYTVRYVCIHHCIRMCMYTVRWFVQVHSTWTVNVLFSMCIRMVCCVQSQAQALELAVPLLFWMPYPFWQVKGFCVLALLAGDAKDEVRPWCTMGGRVVFTAPFLWTMLPQDFRACPSFGRSVLYLRGRRKAEGRLLF